MEPVRSVVLRVRQVLGREGWFSATLVVVHAAGWERAIELTDEVAGVVASRLRRRKHHLAAPGGGEVSAN